MKAWAMTKDLPAEISEFLVNTLESHDDQKLQKLQSQKKRTKERLIGVEGKKMFNSYVFVWKREENFQGED
jgi:hypothetical protein